LCAAPAVLAGLPSLQPAWFAERTWGTPNGVLVMSALMLAFVALAGLFAGFGDVRTVHENGDSK
jgi:hypothetical protein